jgi:ATP-binding cassette, subfamily G (WHITE), member 2, SNQ2
LRYSTLSDHTELICAQAIAAYSPNAYFAALVNPILIGCGLILFCGVVVPYSQIQAFWRYWLYYLDPFTYLIGALLTPVAWDTNVVCESSELTNIPLPSNSTCGDYMFDFLSQNAGYVVDPTSTTSCAYCPYTTGADYLKTLNIKAKYYGWRDVSFTSPCIELFANNFPLGWNNGTFLHIVLCSSFPHDEA